MPVHGRTSGAEDSGKTPVNSRWSLLFWAVVAAVLLAQVLGLSAYFRHHGVFYNTFHELPLMAYRIGRLVTAAAVLRFVLHRWIHLPRIMGCSTGWRSLADLSLETAAITLVLTLTSYAYAWPKVMLPVLNPNLWDVTLARIDSTLCFGINPNEFLLTVFEGAPRIASQLLDGYYGLFVMSQGAVSAWFITEPQMKQRIAFGASVILLWVLGTWTYAITPALGPVYVFEDFLPRIAAIFHTNAAAQVALFNNYQAVQRLIAGENVMIVPHMGIAAMPSLHVAVHFFLYLWARFVGSPLRFLLLAMTTLTFIGSVATGWHYCVDGLVGLILAAGVFGIGAVINRALDKSFASPPGAGEEKVA